MMNKSQKVKRESLEKKERNKRRKGNG